jgi:hypothetical protein
MMSAPTRPTPSAEPEARPPLPIRDEGGEITGYLMNASGAQWLALERRVLRGIGLEEMRREG